jgi:hypothetical protein
MLPRIKDCLVSYNQTSSILFIGISPRDNFFSHSPKETLLFFSCVKVILSSSSAPAGRDQSHVAVLLEKCRSRPSLERSSGALLSAGRNITGRILERTREAVSSPGKLMGEVGQFVALRLSLLHMQPLAFALHFAQIKIHKRNLPVGICMKSSEGEEKALAKYFLSRSTNWRNT